MANFFSAEAERALLGEEAEAIRLFDASTNPADMTLIATPFVDENSQWAHAHTSASGFDYFHIAPASAYDAMAAESGPSASDSSSITSLSPTHGRSLTPGHGPVSRSASPASDLHAYGTLGQDNTWRCTFPGCASRARFARPCDLRKHFHRHSKKYFCRHENCPKASEGGFSSNKDRSRHEAKHNPGILCEFEGCERVFSRTDNMKDHVRRIHRRASVQPAPAAADLPGPSAEG